MLKIDQVLKGLIPPLSSDEYSTLEKSILDEGCRDKIITWNDTIVDGHNRYEICTKHNIPYSTEDRDFESRDSVKVWMIDNQKGRRNLTDGWKFELAQARKKILAVKGRENIVNAQRSRHRGVTLSTIDKDRTHNTREEIAKDIGWSTGKVAMADKVWREAKPEVKEKIKSGEISFNQAYNDIKKEQKKAEKRQAFIEKKNSFDANPAAVKSYANCYNADCLDIINTRDDQSIDLLLSDPPYAMDYKSGWNDWDKIEGDKRNDTVNLLDEAFTRIKTKLKDDAHIYIFSNPNETTSIKPIFEKHFMLKNILIWDREVIGMGDLKTYGRSYDVIYFGYNKTWKDLHGTRDRDILRFARVAPGELIHPTEKPMDLLKYLVKKSSNEGDLVFDPFAGSCTTLKASYELGRNSEGCELESKYIPSWMLKKI